MKVLVVDDSATARYTVISAVKEEVKDCIINEAKNGEECITKFTDGWKDKEPYDIIFLDIEMSHDGLYALGRIRDIERSCAFPSTKIFMITSSVDSRNILKSSKNNANGYFIKGDGLDAKVKNEIRKCL